MMEAACLETQGGDIHDSGLDCGSSDNRSEDITFTDVKNEMSRTLTAEEIRDDKNDDDADNTLKLAANKEEGANKTDSQASTNNETSADGDSNKDKKSADECGLVSKNSVESSESSLNKNNISVETESSDHRKKSNNDRRNGRRRSGRTRSRVRSRSRTPIRRHQNQIVSDKSACRVFVSNIPFHISWQELKQLFQDRIGNVEYVGLFNEENGKPRGCGVVDFTNADSATRAVETMNKISFRNRKLVVKSDYGTERDRTGRIIPESERTSGYNYGNETFGLSTEFLAQLGITPPLSDRVFIANIKFSVQEKTIEEMFSMAGNIRRITLARDNKNGQSRGFGTIQYAHPIEAVQAVSMFNQQMFFDRPITVRMDRCTSNRGISNFPPASMGLPPGLGTIGKGLGVGGAPLQLSQTNSALPINGRYPLDYGYERHSVDLDAHYSQYPSYRSPGVLPGPAIPYPPSIAPYKSPPPYSSAAGGYNLVAQQQQTHQQAPQQYPPQPSASSTPSGSYNNYNAPPAPVAGPPQHSAPDDYRDLCSGHFVWVRNLPITVSTNELLTRFRIVGDVQFIDMKPDGSAIIQYWNAPSARRASTELNHSRIHNKVIEVTLCN